MKNLPIRRYQAIRKNTTMRVYFDGLDIGPERDSIRFDARYWTDIIIVAESDGIRPFNCCFTAGPSLPPPMAGVVVFHDERA